MNKEMVTRSEIKLIGLSIRTNNKNEMNPATSKIAELIGKYASQNIPAKIPFRKNPGITFSVYTDYDSDEHGDYTYFVGEQVDSFEGVLSDLQQRVIPAAQYQKFTTMPGKMPAVVVNAWQQIWQMTPSELGGSRAYIADFEVYDQRASDPDHTILDIYIGVQ